MSAFSRRDFLRQGSLGLAAVGAGGLVLQAGAQPTPTSGKLGRYGDVIALNDRDLPRLPDKLQITEDNILGPFHRAGAPFRAKITPPMEPGVVLVVSGRVWGFDTKK